MHVPEREKTQIHRISLLFYVLQHRNYTSVKILIFLHDISKECNILLSKCKPQPRDSYQDKTKNFMIHGQNQKGKKDTANFSKKLVSFHFKWPVQYFIQNDGIG